MVSAEISTPEENLSPKFALSMVSLLGKSDDRFRIVRTDKRWEPTSLHHSPTPPPILRKLCWKAGMWACHLRANTRIRLAMKERAAPIKRPIKTHRFLSQSSHSLRC